MCVKISIIIPVYNVEQYLRKCLDSCVNQTFKEIEIIVVNDCSPDNSDIIMREYEEKYPDLIKCIYLKKNIRQGGARNRGLEIAQGEYIMFVDSDDYIEVDMCEKMYHSAISNDADLVICDFFVDNFGTIGIKDICYEEPTTYDIDKDVLLYNNFSGHSFHKIFKKDLIINSGYKYKENVFYEDVPVVPIWILKANKINYLKEPLYYYVLREKSVVHTYTEENLYQRMAALLCFVEYMKKEEMFQEFYDFEVCYVFQEIYIIARDMLVNDILFKNQKTIELMKNLCNEIKEFIPDWKNNEFKKDIGREFIVNFIDNSEYFKKIQQRNREYFFELKKNVKRCAIWGYGGWGKRLEKYMAKLDFLPEYVIDNAEELQGEYTINNTLITGFDEIKDKCEVIIITIAKDEAYEEVKKQIYASKSGIEVLRYTDLFIL